MTLRPGWYVDLLDARGATPPAGLLATLCEGLNAQFEPRAAKILTTLSAGFDDPACLSRFLMIHAESERAGAHVIGAVARRPEAEAVRAVMLAHADDEDRHDRMLAALADFVQGRRSEPSPRPDHSSDNEAFLSAYNGDLAGFVCDLHMAEIRSYYFLAAYSQAALASSADYAPKIKACFDEIILDEFNHIAYTAKLLGRWSAKRADLGGQLTAAAGLYGQLVDQKLEALGAVTGQGSVLV